MGEGDRQYWILASGQPYGPYNADEVRRYTKPGSVVSHFQTWLKIEDHPDFQTRRNEVSRAAPPSGKTILPIPEKQRKTNSSSGIIIMASATAFLLCILAVAISEFSGTPSEPPMYKTTREPTRPPVTKQHKVESNTTEIPSDLRKRVFWELVLAEDRADAEAQRLYPLPDSGDPGYSSGEFTKRLRKQAQAMNTLTEKYKEEVCRKHNLTFEQIEEISIEGVVEGWPQPSL